MNYGVEDRQQLPHRGHEGDLRGFTGGAQALIEQSDDEFQHVATKAAIWCEKVGEPSYTSAFPVGPGPGQMR